jgi:hypothetical protein
MDFSFPFLSFYTMDFSFPFLLYDGLFLSLLTLYMCCPVLGIFPSCSLRIILGFSFHGFSQLTTALYIDVHLLQIDMRVGLDPHNWCTSRTSLQTQHLRDDRTSYVSKQDKEDKATHVHTPIYLLQSVDVGRRDCTSANKAAYGQTYRWCSLRGHC